MILDKADGNPFYLEEIVRDLIEKGALVQDEPTGRWRATKLIAEVTVPDTIQGCSSPASTGWMNILSRWYARRLLLGVLSSTGF